MDRDTFYFIRLFMFIAFFYIVMGIYTYKEKYEPDEVTPVASIKIVQTPTFTPTFPKVRAHHDHIKFVLDTIPVYYNTEIDTSEYTCLLYATESIGRYYITAYNHKETGSKMTASGTTCHEGVITTCAADPRYHKFGEYLEIGGRLYRVEDTGFAVKKRHIDVYFASYKEMARFGSHYETIYRVSFPFGMPKEGE